MRQTVRTTHVAIALILTLCIPTLAVAQDDGGGEAPEAPQNIAIPPTDGVDLSLRLSRNVDAEPVETVVLASEESFADAMASALLQQVGPVLLIPPTLPVPGEVYAELQRLAPSEVILLGGTAAISEEVEADLARVGFQTRRIAGGTRFDTAIQIAQQTRPNATQAILVRAFDSAGGSTSGAWADSVSAGALSTQLQIPMLLTETNQLTGPTGAYLEASAISTVIIVGGVSAVSAGVEQGLRDAGYIVTRVAGSTRFETALEVAQFRRLTPVRAIFIDGTAEDGWQAGFVAARHAWLEGAPILPTAGAEIPAPIAAYLEQVQPLAVSCLGVLVPGCGSQGGGSTGGASVEVTYNPASGSAVAPGEFIVVGIDDPERTLTGEVAVASDCMVSGYRISPEYGAEGSVNFNLSLPNEELGGDQPHPGGAVLVQPTTTTDEMSGSPQPSGTGEPVEPNEPRPVDYPTPCEVTTTFETVAGDDLVDVSIFQVVDLRPRIRIASFPMVEDEPIAFADRSGGVVDTWEWDFGDGNGSTDQHPTHTYAEPGCYDVELTVTSAVRHWFTGQLFQDREIRTIGVHPSDDEARVEIIVLNGTGPIPGAVVQMQELNGTLVATATAGSDGVAVFEDVPHDGAAVPHQTYRFLVDGEPGFTDQVIAPGHTVCPGLQIGATASLEITTINDADGRPVVGASVSLMRDGFQFGDLTNDQGVFSATDIPAGTYDLNITADGFITEEVGNVALSPDENLQLEIRMRPS